MFKSRKLVSGDIVARSGNKFIRCGRTQTPIGVWRDAGKLVVLTLDNKVESIDLPAGVQLEGVMNNIVVDLLDIKSDIVLGEE